MANHKIKAAEDGKPVGELRLSVQFRAHHLQAFGPQQAGQFSQGGRDTGPRRRQLSGELRLLQRGGDGAEQGVEHRIDLAANILRVGDGAWPQDLVGDLVGEVAEQLVGSGYFRKPSA